MEKSKFDKTSLDIPIILYKTKNKNKIEKKNNQKLSSLFRLCVNMFQHFW